MLYDNMINVFRKIKNLTCSWEELYGRDVIAYWVKKRFADFDGIKCLDIGCGAGKDLSIVRSICPSAMLFGTDIICSNNTVIDGLSRVSCNLECEQLPFPNQMFDLIIANQVFEHLKNWTFALHETARVLKPGGVLIIGVPNLASLHNRILLLMGRQPSSISTTGMHVRGFTCDGVAMVLGHKNVFAIRDLQGKCFYPFPEKISQYLVKIWPKASVTIFFMAELTGNPSDLMSIESMTRLEELSVVNKGE